MMCALKISKSAIFLSRGRLHIDFLVTILDCSCKNFNSTSLIDSSQMNFIHSLAGVRVFATLMTPCLHFLAQGHPDYFNCNWSKLFACLNQITSNSPERQHKRNISDSISMETKISKLRTERSVGRLEQKNAKEC